MEGDNFMAKSHPVSTFAVLIAMLFAMAFILIQFHSCSASVQPTNSGIIGTVMIGPISPVEKVGEINVKPYQNAVIFIMDAAGKQKIAETTSDQEGRFRVNLAPATYQLLPQTPKNRSLPIGIPKMVVVEAGKFTEITVSYDSGIR